MQIMGITPMNDVQRRNLNDINVVASYYRGNLINAFIEMEGVIDTIITHHFCKEEFQIHKQFGHRVISSLDFMIKHKTVMLIIVQSYPRLKDKYPGISKNITELIGLRNAMAHFKVVNDIDAINSYQNATVRFISFSIKDQEFTYPDIIMTPDLYNEKVILLNNTSDMVQELARLMDLESQGTEKVS